MINAVLHTSLLQVTLTCCVVSLLDFLGLTERLLSHAHSSPAFASVSVPAAAPIFPTCIPNRSSCCNIITIAIIIITSPSLLRRYSIVPSSLPRKHQSYHAVTSWRFAYGHGATGIVPVEHAEAGYYLEL